MPVTLLEKRDLYTQIVKSHSESGKPVEVFCKENNLAPSTFYYWCKKLNAVEKGKEKVLSKNFIPLSVSSSSQKCEEDIQRATISIAFPSGIHYSCELTFS